MFKISYSEQGGVVFHSRAQVSRQRRMWVITGSYSTPQGAQTFSVKTKTKCYMTELSDLIEQVIREDEAAAGAVDDIKWTAIGR